MLQAKDTTRSGEKNRKLYFGDVVNISTNVKHWHGATKDSCFSYLAIEVPAENSSSEWLAAVDDEVYRKLK